MMTVEGLKDRENFMNNYLKPTISNVFVSALYPDSPHHPRQKYLLTKKGKELLEYLLKDEKEVSQAKKLRLFLLKSFLRWTWQNQPMRQKIW